MDDVTWDLRMGRMFVDEYTNQKGVNTGVMILFRRLQAQLWYDFAAFTETKKRTCGLPTTAIWYTSLIKLDFSQARRTKLMRSLSESI